jgi:hypothetical protein
MVVRTDRYPEGLIRAIDSWQLGSKDKARKARRLRDLSRALPDNYREAPKEVFRQVRTTAPLLGMGIALDVIPETVSSWTTSLEVAKRFREEDQDRRKAMIIFARRPEPKDIILNLNPLYADGDFLDTVEATAKRLGKPFRGIDRWRDRQKEVVLKETVIGNDEIVTLGAFRQLSDVVPLVGSRDVDAPSDDQIFKMLVHRPTNEHFWTSPESADNGIRNAAERIREFLAEKRLWPED